MQKKNAIRWGTDVKKGGGMFGFALRLCYLCGCKKDE